MSLTHGVFEGQQTARTLNMFEGFVNVCQPLRLCLATVNSPVLLRKGGSVILLPASCWHYVTRGNQEGNLSCALWRMGQIEAAWQRRKDQRVCWQRKLREWIGARALPVAHRSSVSRYLLSGKETASSNHHLPAINHQHVPVGPEGSLVPFCLTFISPVLTCASLV